MFVVEAYLNDGVGLKEAAATIGTNPSQASRWVRAFLSKGTKELKKNVKKGKACPRNKQIRPAETPPETEVSDEDLREYCEQLKFENDVLRAEPELFSKKAEASAKED